MAFNTKIVQVLPYEQRHNYADRTIPDYPVQGNSSSLSSFTARGPAGLTLVYIGWQGILWRTGNTTVDHFAGQIQVCQRGTEARWISANAMQRERLGILRRYVYTYRPFHAESHIQYLQTKLRNLEPQFGTDVIACNDGVYDPSYSSELLEMIVGITEKFTFLRKIQDKANANSATADGPISAASREPVSDAHLWVSCYQLDSAIDEYIHKRDKWVAMQSRPELEPEPEPISIPEPVKEQVCESIA